MRGSYLRNPCPNCNQVLQPLRPEYPAVYVNLDAISSNSMEILRYCRARGVHVDAVLKGVCGDPVIARAVIEGGIESFMDSRMRNIVRMKRAGIDARMGLLRIPTLGELDLMLSHCDWALVSMPEMIAAIEEKCREAKKSFEIVLMTDIGDLREGILPEHIPQAAEILARCSYVTCVGLGTNLGCFGGILPSVENMVQLIALAEQLRSYLEPERWLVSAGGSQVYYDMVRYGEERIPIGITHIRPGGVLLRGRCMDNDVPTLRQDTMRLDAEYCEIAVKPSKPYGNIGTDAFGNVPCFLDRGPRTRGIVALGRQDALIEDLEPLRAGVEILGASSDHMILDLENLVEKPRLGDTESFTFRRYGAMLQVFTSEYTEKIYVRDRVVL